MVKKWRGLIKLSAWFTHNENIKKIRETITAILGDSTHKENIKKIRETITPILDTRKLCVSKYFIERGHSDSTKII